MSEILRANPEEAEFERQTFLQFMKQRLWGKFGIEPTSLSNKELIYLSILSSFDVEKLKKDLLDIDTGRMERNWIIEPEVEAVYLWFQHLYGLDPLTLEDILGHAIGEAVLDPRTGSEFFYTNTKEDKRNAYDKAGEIFKSLSLEERKKILAEQETNLIRNVLRPEDAKYIEFLREKARNQSENDD